MSKVFMIMNKLNKGAGSTRVIMNRSSSLVHRGYDVSLLTFRDYNEEEIKSTLRKMGRLNKRVKVLNIYEYYQRKSTTSKISKKQKKYYKSSSALFEKGYKVQSNKSKTVAKYFKNGIYIKRKRWKENGTLSHINYYSEERKKISQEKFDKKGFVSKKTYYDFADEQPIYIQYFTRDGFCYYARDKKTGYNYLFERNSPNVKQFRNDSEFYTYWLNQLCSKQKQKPYIITDKKECAPRVMNMKADVAYRIYAIHRNHFESPFKIGSPMRLQEKKILDQIKSLERVVVLTENQKKDIIELYGDYGNIRVIPNSINQISDEKLKKDNKIVSMVARLAPIKQIDQAINAFQQVVHEIPDAKLEIHGSGNLEDRLRKQIKNLNLTENVFLKGYANNTDLVYKRSLVTLLTTKSEAFALVILESMANGTPVISYDVNYGPSDIITNGEDGYLIEQDVKVLADKIIELLNNPRKAYKMGERAKKNAFDKFSEKKVIDKWIQLFKELKEDS